MKTRTIKQIEQEIEHAIAARKNFSELAHEEEDKDYRMGYYNNIDRCNDVLDELVNEKNKLLNAKI